MGISSYGLDEIKEEVLNAFDVVSHMGFGDGTTPDDESKTALDNELVRNVLIESTKDLGNGTYEFVCRVALSQLNSVVISEIGIFDSPVSGVMVGRQFVLDENITKTSNDELIVTLLAQVQITNGN